MFDRILIANRGEIACRVAATARRLGIRSVAVYSDADAEARHVALADEAVRIGPAAAADSYLRGERIIEAALASGAQAIHPGYGFLSENPDFADAVGAAGLVFVGPPAKAIRAMGLKDAAKTLMTEAGVPVVPGYHGPAQEPALLAAEADKIGYPVMIKARAGGGGKGMRLVEDASAFAAALEGARREAETSFGDPACLIEKFVARPRHVEIQVFADAHGNALHLFERDCSLQRRHQKVIEEAPAPGMTARVREAMGQAAVDAALAIGYVGAGTVEFIVDATGDLRSDGFWFMEMNTRLQVEHPVTEAITGLDLVELQLRIAGGEPLPFRQKDLRIDGHAIEARIYAEDVGAGFLPSTGRLDHLALPPAAEFVPGRLRIDSGVREGDEISPWYDPMIAKLIVHGPTRATALNLLDAALSECRLTGADTNLEFLGRLSRQADFVRGRIDTGLIARDLDALTRPLAPPAHAIGLAALGGLGLLRARDGVDPWERLAGWRHWTDARQYIALEDGDSRFERRVTALGRDCYEIEDDAGLLRLHCSPQGGSRYLVTQDDLKFRVDVVIERGRVTVFTGGRGFGFALPDALAASADEQASGDAIIAPMPGLVRVVASAAGQQVARGEALLVLEAMKMEHTLSAPRDGVVAEVNARVGDQVTEGTILLTLAAEHG